MKLKEKVKESTASTKKKITPNLKTVEDSSVDPQKLANQFKKIEAELKANDAEMKKKRDKVSDLKKSLIAHCNENLDAEEILELRTKWGDVKVGKRSTSRTITDMVLAVKLIGKDTFMRIAKISLGDLDKYLNPEELAQVIETKVTDTRRIT